MVQLAARFDCALAPDSVSEWLRFGQTPIIASQVSPKSSAVLVYADDASGPAKRERAISLILEHQKSDSLVVSLQVLQEYYAAATKRGSGRWIGDRRGYRAESIPIDARK